MEVVGSGPGISAENLPKLFGQYVQFDASTVHGDNKGSGLGLWLSKAIVEMHGGVIGGTFEGEEKGCTLSKCPAPSRQTANLMPGAQSRVLERTRFA